MPKQPAAHSDIELQELSERISWLIRLRWAAAIGVIATVAGASHLLHVRLSELPLYAITVGLAAYNLVLWAVSRSMPPSASPASRSAFANVQIGADLLFLTALLHFSGGIENPFSYYYVFHIVIASILLSRRATFVHACIALGLLSLMAALEGTGRVAHYHLGVMGPVPYQSPTYVLAVLFVIGTTLGFTAFMATSITARLRERESEIVRLSLSLRQHSADLQASYESLARLERGKSAYLHRVAHHLRSPLAALERMLAVVSEGRTGPLSDQSKEMIDRSRRRVRDILELARDLLALSRARESAPRAGAEIDLRAVIASVVSDYQPQAVQASVSLESDVEAQLPPVVGDAESIAELLENLTSNAVKYTPAGGRVRVAARGAEGQVEISVADSGIGIPVEDQASIFDEFYRAGNARSTGKEGTGLGLSIVRAIARAHGGEVSVDSTAGVGSTFRVVLPAASSTNPQAKAQSTTTEGLSRV